jgi:hypothetical protein
MSAPHAQQIGIIFISTKLFLLLCFSKDKFKLFSNNEENMKIVNEKTINDVNFKGYYYYYNKTAPINSFYIKHII